MLSNSSVQAVEHSAATSILQAGRPKDLQAACVSLARESNFDWVFMAVRLPFAGDAAFSSKFSSFPKNWAEHYKQRRYSKVDPALAHVTKSRIPMFWDELERPNVPASALSVDARNHGIYSGLSVSVAGHANSLSILSFAGSTIFDSNMQKRNSTKSSILLAATYLHEKLLHFASKESKTDQAAVPMLTPRERQCLILAAKGLTGKQVALKLGISPATVAFHIDHCIKRLDTKTRSGAISRALVLGEITLADYSA